MNLIYNNIGNGYDTTRRADPEIVNRLIELIDLKPDGNYLDVACGTGNYTCELSKRGGCWKAFDQSELMLAKAKEKTKAIEWNLFDVIRMGYSNEYFDAAVCTLAIHHFPNLPLAFSEIHRVIAPQGKFIIFTATEEQMESYWLKQYFPHMLQCATKQMPSFSAIDSALTNAGFHTIRVDPFLVSAELTDLFLYSGKLRPQMYLSETVRAGISSSRNFCSPEELHSGLASLAEDIESGKIVEVIEQFANAPGDYCFIIATR